MGCHRRPIARSAAAVDGLSSQGYTRTAVNRGSARLYAASGGQSGVINGRRSASLSVARRNLVIARRLRRKRLRGDSVSEMKARGWGFGRLTSALVGASIAFALALGLAPISSASVVLNKTYISNVSNNGFTVSWLTTTATTGYVRLANQPSSHFDDKRGADYVGYTHYVEITNLVNNAQFQYSIVSGDQTQAQTSTSANFNPRTAINLANKAAVNSLTGTVSKNDGTTPAANVIVYAVIKATSSGTTVNSSRLAAYTDDNGYYSIDLSLATDQPSDSASSPSKYFTFNKSTDTVTVNADSSNANNATQTVSTSFASLGGSTADVLLTLPNADPAASTPTIAPTATGASSGSSPSPISTAVPTIVATGTPVPTLEPEPTATTEPPPLTRRVLQPTAAPRPTLPAVVALPTPLPLPIQPTFAAPPTAAATPAVLRPLPPPQTATPTAGFLRPLPPPPGSLYTATPSVGQTPSPTPETLPVLIGPTAGLSVTDPTPPGIVVLIVAAGLMVAAGLGLVTTFVVQTRGRRAS